MNPKTSQDLFNKIRSQFSNIKIGDENGAATADAAEAVFFEFEFQPDSDTFGSVSVSIADGENMKVYYNRDLVAKIDESDRDEWYAFLKELKDFYFDNYDSIMELQNDKVKRGTDQPVYNYLLQIKNIDVKTELPDEYMLTHLTRFDWFSHNWQLNEDTTPFFIKYGYIWKYSGFPKRGDRYDLMKQTWAMVKDNYK